MGAVKIRTADKHFSKCIRERAGWKCERCGSQHQENTQGLHCSHFHGRGKWATRFDPDNCEALCYGCHSYMEQHPVLHEQRIRKKLGEGLFQILLEKARSTKLGRWAKRSEKVICAHYREEHKRLKQLRADGETGYLQLENWQ